MLTHLHGLTEERMEELGLYNILVLSVWFAIAYTERDKAESDDHGLFSQDDALLGCR
jgi:hypothetical protein